MRGCVLPQHLRVHSCHRGVVVILRASLLRWFRALGSHSGLVWRCEVEHWRLGLKACPSKSAGLRWLGMFLTWSGVGSVEGRAACSWGEGPLHLWEKDTEKPGEDNMVLIFLPVFPRFLSFLWHWCFLFNFVKSFSDDLLLLFSNRSDNFCDFQFLLGLTLWLFFVFSVLPLFFQLPFQPWNLVLTKRTTQRKPKQLCPFP